MRFRVLARTLLALIALYAANDFLLTPYPALADDAIRRQSHRHMAVLVAVPAEDDENHHGLPTGGPEPILFQPDEAPCLDGSAPLASADRQGVHLPRAPPPDGRPRAPPSAFPTAG